MWDTMTKDEGFRELQSIDAEIEEDARIAHMREQVESYVKRLDPEVVAVFVFGTAAMPWANSESEEFTAIAVKDPDDLESFDNMTCEGETQGQALLELLAIYKSMNAD